MTNFYSDPVFREKLRLAAKKAREQAESLQPPNSVRTGDAFLFPETVELPVRWIAVLSHKDNSNLWYLIAADEFPKVGTCDVELPACNAMAPLSLRCAIGFWAHNDDIEFDRYVGQLDAESVADVRDRLDEMVRGEVPVTEHGIIADADDDYRDWTAELSQAVEQIEQRIQSDPVVLRTVNFDASWAERLPDATKRADGIASLAADASGQQSVSQVPLGAVLPSRLPGSLVIYEIAAEFDLMYFPIGADDKPPRLSYANGLSVKEGKWVSGIDGAWTWSQALSASDGQVSFAIGVEKFEIQV